MTAQDNYKFINQVPLEIIKNHILCLAEKRSGVPVSQKDFDSYHQAVILETQLFLDRIYTPVNEQKEPSKGFKLF